MYRLLIVVAFLCGSQRLYAQHENNIWILGYNVGLDFNSGQPVVFPVNEGAQSTSSRACVSDANGRLLFYSTNDTVRNRLRQIMPHGAGLDSPHFGSHLNSCDVIPVVGHPEQYYLFTIDDRYSRVKYSKIDMSLDGGLGDVVPAEKGMILPGSFSSCLTAISGNGCYTWLVGHTRNTGEFIAYRIDASGMSATPVISSCTSLTGSYPYYVCDLASSPDGKRLAIASDGGNFTELFDFNTGTGVVSNARLLNSFGSTGRAHTECFSPDGSKLYVCGGYSGSDLVQYDLNKLPVVSAQVINDSSYLNGGMRLGPDGKIYCANWEGVYTILRPDEAGKACNLSFSYVPLPQNVQSAARLMGVNMVKPVTNISAGRSDTVICSGSTAVLQGSEAFEKYVWSDGDTVREKIITGSSKLWLQSSSGCSFRTDTFSVLVSDCQCVISIPDAFTPNNDGHNDVFRPLGYDVARLEFHIYNRYGQRVFASYKTMQAWDGTFNGIPCEAGTYFYTVRSKCLKGQDVYRKGDVLLIR